MVLFKFLVLPRVYKNSVKDTINCVFKFYMEDKSKLHDSIRRDAKGKVIFKRN